MPLPIPDPFERTVCLFVRITDGKCSMLDGSQLPKLKEGSLAELIIAPYAFENEEDLARFTEEYTVPFLPVGTVLWVRIKDDDALPPELKKCLISKSPKLENKAHFVPVILKAELQLFVRAGKYGKLWDCEVHIPDLSMDAKSLNEAYTKVSIAFEPSRRSHAGNVFREVYYESGGDIRPLKVMRMSAEMMPKPPPPPPPVPPAERLPPAEGDLFNFPA